MGAAAVLVLAQTPGLLRRALESRVLRGFGKYSYGAYVLHTPMEPVFLRLVPPEKIAGMARGLGHSGSRLVGLLGFGAIGIGGTMLLALASYYAYEKPFLGLKRYFEYDRSSGPAVAPRPAAEPSAEP
ncbi:MAG TPA: hypothetical protein VKU41_20460 [Polyangiaceae bacterium]|nr:hypothetical protein [Polyangiaceae bacterium]